MYKKAIFNRTQLKSVELLEGEPIENKIERILVNKEPIKDGAPAIYTERKEGVLAGYNIRTDRWEEAATAMDKVSKSILAKREERAKQADEKANMKIVKDEPTQGTTGEQGSI